MIMMSGMRFQFTTADLHSSLAPLQACSFTWTNGRLRMNHRSSYSGTLTQRYDDYAMKHLAGALPFTLQPPASNSRNHATGVLFPLAAGFALFSLVHKPHKSWCPPSCPCPCASACVFRVRHGVMC